MSYHGLSVLKPLTFGLERATDGLRLYKHFEELFSSIETVSEAQKVESGHVVIIGGGATGAELAGELAADLRRSAEKHGLDSSYVTVDRQRRRWESG